MTNRSGFSGSDTMPSMRPPLGSLTQALMALADSGFLQSSVGSPASKASPAPLKYSGARSMPRRIDKPSALALYALLAGNFTFAGGIEHSIADLDLTLSLVMADDQAI